MKENELRLGNFVYYNYGIVMYVEAIFESGDVHLNFEYNEGDIWDTTVEEIKPIPLTEEWLVKFGFQKRKSGKFRVVMEAWYYKEYEQEFIKFKEDVAVFFMEDREIQLPYVHQLQNIYFALTGEELLLK